MSDITKGKGGPTSPNGGGAKSFNIGAKWPILTYGHFDTYVFAAAAYFSSIQRATMDVRIGL